MNKMLLQSYTEDIRQVLSASTNYNNFLVSFAGIAFFTITERILAR